jgi:hypothetical protein
MIDEAHTILAPTNLTQDHAEGARELLGPALMLADHLLTEKPAAVLGAKGWRKDQTDDDRQRSRLFQADCGNANN